MCACVAVLAWTVAASAAERPAGSAVAAFDAPTYVTTSWTTAEGLPSNTIRTLAQTPDGYVWLGTDAGVVRFDGVRFTVFGLADGLASTRVSSLLVDRAGTLWLGTLGGGVSRWDGRRFRTWTARDGLGNDNVEGLLEVADGTLWIQTRTGVDVMRGDRLAPAPAAAGAGDRNGVPLDMEGVVLNAPPPPDLFRVADGTIRLARVPPGLDAARVKCLLLDHAGTLWLCAGAQLFRFRDGRWTTFGMFEGSAAEVVLRLAERGDGSIWLTQGAGDLYSVREGTFVPVRCRPALGADLNTALLADRQGAVWMGTYRDGLVRLRRERVGTWEAEETMQVLAVAEARDGTLWAGTVGNGLRRARNGRLEPCDLGSKAWNEATVFGVVASAGGGVGDLWLALPTVLLRWTPGRAAVPFPLDMLGPKETARVLASDAAGGVWLGTDMGRVLRLEQDRVVVVTDALAGNRVTALLVDPDGTLWIGTAAGLYRFEGGRLTTYARTDGLRSAWIRTLYRSHDGTLWIGTGGGGLGCLRDGRLTSFTASHGLPNDFISQILEDDAGDFWFGCNRGLFRIARAEMDALVAGRIGFVHAALLGRPEGLVAEECTGNFGTACRKTRTGRLCFATLKGLAVVDPGRVKASDDRLRVALESVAVDDAARPDPAAALDIPAGAHRVEIRFTGLGSSMPERIAFRYRMDGLEDWVEAGTSRVALYHRLPPGRYRFRVQAANESGAWGAAEAALVVVAEPGVWQTGWVRSSLAALLVALAYAWHRSRLRRQSRARRMQEEFSRRLIESQEQERKRVAAELHDGLGQNLLLVKSRLHALATECAAAPELEERVRQTSDVTSQAIAEVRAITAALRPAALGSIGLTRAVEAMIEQVSSASTTTFSTEIESIDGLLEPDQEIHLYRVIQEGINNVIKHSGAEQAILEVRREPQAIHVSLYDNGRGFVPPGAGGDGAGCGLGLIGMAERSRVLHGTLELQSMPGRGTRLTVRIPVRGARP